MNLSQETCLRKESLSGDWKAAATTVKSRPQNVAGLYFFKFLIFFFFLWVKLISYLYHLNHFKQKYYFWREEV